MISGRNRDREGVPAFLSFDVEPHGLALGRPDLNSWSGFDHAIEVADLLRSRLKRARRGAPPRFGWYFRTDPQIARVFGSPEYVLRERREDIARLVGRGDYLGVHAHSISWSEHRRQWFHDFSDREWIAHSTRSALGAFARWNGSPALRFRAGGGLLTNDIIEAADQCGVKVDLTLELGAALDLQWWKRTDAIEGSLRSAGRATDCRMAPRVAYRPAPDDFRIPGGMDARRLFMVPLTTGPALRPRSAWRRLARRLILGPDQYEVLYPSEDWPSGRFYWDLVERGLQTMSRPFISLAIRTDSAGSVRAHRVRRILEELPSHPLAERLCFVDPLEVASDLV